MIFFRWILLPFALLYGLVIAVIDILYNTGLLKSVKFDIPVISVGNLSVGGTGKTPHIQYLIQLLQKKHNVALLSRGYKRKTKGYLLANKNSSLQDIGDEPLLIKQQFPTVPVAVGENRVLAILDLLTDNPKTEAVLLDDAFQHRSLIPGLSVLLTDYAHLFTMDYLLPLGRLREMRAAYKRADVIVVTKSPAKLPEADKNKINREINPLAHQQVCFSYLRYGKIYDITDNKKKLTLNKDIAVLLFCGIANPQSLIGYLQEKVKSVKICKYPDHYYYKETDLQAIQHKYDNIQSNSKVILTTEKDAVRLNKYFTWLKNNNLSIYCIPIEIAFDEEEKNKFDEKIFNFINKM